MKKTVIILIASVAFAFCAEAQTAQKLATVNIRLLFDGYFKTKQADNEIKARASEFDAEGKKYQDEYKSLTEKYNAALAKVTYIHHLVFTVILSQNRSDFYNSKISTDEQRTCLLE